MDDELDEQATPVIWVHIRLTRRFGALPPAATAAWNALKNAVFALGLLGTLTLLIAPRVVPSPEALGIPCAVVLAWMVYDRILMPARHGLSHILVTSRGVLFSDENLYLMWDEIESYQLVGDLCRLIPKADAASMGFFSKGRTDIPVSDNNRELLKELLAKNVARWQPK